MIDRFIAKGKGELSNISKTGGDEFIIDKNNNLSNFIRILSSTRSTCVSEIRYSFGADLWLTLIKA